MRRRALSARACSGSVGRGAARESGLEQAVGRQLEWRQTTPDFPLLSSAPTRAGSQGISGFLGFEGARVYTPDPLKKGARPWWDPRTGVGWAQSDAAAALIAVASDALLRVSGL